MERILFGVVKVDIESKDMSVSYVSMILLCIMYQ